jgi:L-alanine-DL-glutamate epimerase-like enolase superfamily enzyme
MILKNLKIIFLKNRILKKGGPYPSFFNDGYVFIKLYDENDICGYGEPSPYICNPDKMIKLLKSIFLKYYKNLNCEKIDIVRLKKKIKDTEKKNLLVCFDQAIKDILAKKKGISVSELISDKKIKNNKISLYASGGMIFENENYDKLIDEAIKSKEKGFFGWKFRPSFPLKNLSHRERVLNPPPFDINKIIKFSKNLRKKVGNNFKLMLDCGSRCKDLAEADYLIRSLEDLNFYFIEEPVVRNYLTYKKLMKNNYKIKIAGGENINSTMEFMKWKKCNIDIFQPDTNLLLFEELFKINKNYDKKIIMHNWCNPINFNTNINYMRSEDTMFLIEKNILPNPYEIFFKNTSFKIINGKIKYLSYDGLGIEFIKNKNKNIKINEIEY